MLAQPAAVLRPMSAAAPCQHRKAAEAPAAVPTAGYCPEDVTQRAITLAGPAERHGLLERLDLTGFKAGLRRVLAGSTALRRAASGICDVSARQRFRLEGRGRGRSCLVQGRGTEVSLRSGSVLSVPSVRFSQAGLLGVPSRAESLA